MPLVNPVETILDWIFGNVSGRGDSIGGPAPTGSVDSSGLTAGQIADAAAQADAIFNTILGSAAAAVGTATAPSGTPFVAGAAALVGAKWNTMPAKEKAKLWTGK